RAFEQEIVRAMVICLAEGEPTVTDGSHGRRMPVMRRFRDMLEEHPDKPLYVAEICAAIGVSDRTLRLHCQEQVGISPHRYLWLRRMHQARRALTVANATKRTVTEIATDFGFWELGRFSVAYKRLFGEAPSATLRALG